MRHFVFFFLLPSPSHQRLVGRAPGSKPPRGFDTLRGPLTLKRPEAAGYNLQRISLVALRDCATQNRALHTHTHAGSEVGTHRVTSLAPPRGLTFCSAEQNVTAGKAKVHLLYSKM